ncbi:MAG TPA: GEVED domain-containing protein [Flavobacterium sp.]|jgi:hypothetical protein
MKHQYPFLFTNPSFYLRLLTVVFVLFFSNPALAQDTYTLGTGTVSAETLGVNPFATINMNSRSQYLILAQELLDEGAIPGNIIAIDLNVTVLAEPSTLKPENISIKLGMTDDVVSGTSLVEGLPEYYSSAVENINTTGWHTFMLSTPFEWDGLSNIVVEICRSNATFGTSFKVQSTLYNPEDYRTVGLYTNNTGVSGCSLTGTSTMTNSDRRIRPNFRVTMTDPCDGTPEAGITLVTEGPYCSGAPFTLSIEDGATASGLFYQWQASPNGNGLWEDIPGANNTTYTTTQSIATYYRRATTCLESQQTINSLAVFVAGDGCYCNAQVVNENEIGITNVTFADIDNTSSGDVLYSNFTPITGSITNQSNFSLSVRVNTSGGTNYTRAWIDWNGNALFEESESYDLGSVTGGNDVNSGTTAVVTVPMDAVGGITTMRVRTAQSALNAVPACGPVDNGEAEDYSLSLLLGNPGHINTAADALVYATGNGAMVLTRHADITSVHVYDLSGRLLADTNNVNGSDVYIENLYVSGQVLVFKIITTEGITITKKAVF